MRTARTVVKNTIMLLVARVVSIGLEYDTSKLRRWKHLTTPNLRKLYQYREFLWMWTIREIKARYKQSFLGVAWAVIQPMSMMLVFTLVFSFLTRVPTDGVPYPLFSYAALLPWTLLQTSITFGVPSLINNLNLVTKIYFPREILPIGAIGAAFFDFLISSVIFVFLLFLYRVSLSWAILWVPVLLVLEFILILGVTLLGAAVIVSYRDVRFIVPLGLQIWLYVSPVIYPLSVVPERLRAYYMLNPMAGILDAFRQVLLFGQSPTWESLAISAAEAMGLFMVGYRVFKESEASFADVI